MKLIFINRYFWPDESATSLMLSDLAFGLVEQKSSFDIWVVTSRLRYEHTGAPLAARETARGVHIVRAWTSSFGRGNLLGRAVDYATFYLSAVWTVLWLARRGDIVIAKTDPPLLSVVVATVARLRGARLINWMQDVFPEVATALGMQGARMKMLRRMRDHSLKVAAANVVLGDLMAERVRACGVQNERITVIPNWSDGDVIRPLAPEANALRRAWGLEGKFVVAYSGNLGRAHEVSTIVDAIAAIERDGPGQIAWVFIGAGAQYEALRRQIEARGLRSVQFRPYQPRARLAESLCVGDAHLVSLQPQLEGLIVPSKIYGVLAAGRPAIHIGANDGEVARVLAEGRCGTTVVPGDGARLAQIVTEWAADRALLQAMGSRARVLFSARFERRLALTRWQALLEHVAAGKSSDADTMGQVSLGEKAPTRRAVGGAD